MAPLLLGFILGGLLEDNLRRTLMLSDGELNFFLERPAFITLVVITLLIILLPMVRGLLSKASGETHNEP